MNRVQHHPINRRSICVFSQQKSPLHAINKGYTREETKFGIVMRMAGGEKSMPLTKLLQSGWCDASSCPTSGTGVSMSGVLIFDGPARFGLLADSNIDRQFVGW